MAATSNRSPSPISSRINPILRTPESGNSIRKTFGGHPVAKPSIAAVPRGFNPVTPANSPADFSHKNLGSKEGMSTNEQKEKENERDRNSPNLIRGKSPVVSKGTKNFMAPTISAASKITPSPKKKVLAERNEPVRISTPFSDGKSPVPSLNSVHRSEIEEIKSKIEMFLDSQVLSDTPKIPEILPKQRTTNFDTKEDLSLSCFPVLASSEFSETKKIGSKPVMGIDSHVLPDTQKVPEALSESIKADELRPSSLPVSVSPDIDPSLPPYDPKTNFLSPRPQFLRYKPNPRIEVYINKEKDFDPGEGKNLEDSFTTESCSDSELIEEIQSPNTETDSTDALSSELKAENETENHDLESKSLDGNLIEESLGAEETPRKRPLSFARPKFVSFLLVLAVVCLSVSVTDSPVISSTSMFKDHLLTKTVLTDSYLRDPFSEFAEFASANVEWVSYNVQRWSMNSISYLSRMISVPREGESSQFIFMNFTVSDTDISVNKLLSDVNPMEDIGEIETKAKEEESGSQGLEMEGETERALEEEQGHSESENVEEEQVHLESEIVEEQRHLESEVHETSHEEVIDEIHEEVSHDLRTERETVEAKEIHEKCNISPRTNIEPTNGEISAQNLESDADYQTRGGREMIDSTVSLPADNFPMQIVLGVSSILLTLAAAATSLFLKKNKASVPENEILKLPLSPKKMTSDSVSASSDSHPRIDRSSFYRNWSAEVDVGESGPLEMSSSLEDTSCSRRGSERREIKSHETKLRRNTNRESMVSTTEYSAGSPSYGSFTTYEKLHGKQVSGDDDAKTPVRRSSRLRKQITSP